MIAKPSLYGMCAAVALLALPAAAAEGPAFDCAEADGEVQELICRDDALGALDRQMTQSFDAALAAAAASLAGEAATETLRAAQRGWIGGRDECWKADDMRACVEAAYLMRDAQLVARWFLMPPIGLDMWTCEDAPSETLAAAYFDTAVGSVRLQLGAEVDVGIEGPSGSGVRYEASFGRTFAMKGADGTLEWPEGEFHACTLNE